MTTHSRPSPRSKPSSGAEVRSKSVGASARSRTAAAISATADRMTKKIMTPAPQSRPTTSSHSTNNGNGTAAGLAAAAASTAMKSSNSTSYPGVAAAAGGAYTYTSVGTGGPGGSSPILVPPSSSGSMYNNNNNHNTTSSSSPRKSSSVAQGGPSSSSSSFAANPNPNVNVNSTPRFARETASSRNARRRPPPPPLPNIPKSRHGDSDVPSPPATPSLRQRFASWRTLGRNGASRKASQQQLPQVTRQQISPPPSMFSQQPTPVTEPYPQRRIRVQRSADQLRNIKFATKPTSVSASQCQSANLHTPRPVTSGVDGIREFRSLLLVLFILLYHVRLLLTRYDLSSNRKI